MSDTDTTSDGPEKCPVCGGEYDYKREVVGTTGRKSADLRADATQCKTRPIGGQQTVYVHR